MSVKEEKKALRKRMLEQRLRLDPGFKEAYDRRICLALEHLIRTRGARIVHSYIPMAGEINIRPLLQKLLDENIRVVCPKTLPKRRLENRVLHSLDALETGIMGTRHPLAADLYEGPIDLILVPGLACDAALYRLGYGGGYYDSFLSQHPEAFKAGLFYPFQKVEAVPREAQDERLDLLLLMEED